MFGAWRTSNLWYVCRPKAIRCYLVGQLMIMPRIHFPCSLDGNTCCLTWAIPQVSRASSRLHLSLRSFCILTVISLAIKSLVMVHTSWDLCRKISKPREARGKFWDQGCTGPALLPTRLHDFTLFV